MGKKISPKLTKKDIEVCRRAYCNPECKTTLFESGKEFPNALKKDITKRLGKNAKMMLKFVKMTRKNIFRGKTSVLQNDFYEKIPSRNISKAKSEGALSGCTLYII